MATIVRGGGGNSGELVNAARYGASTSASAATNAAAIHAALAVGDTFLPAGSYVCDPITIPGCRRLTGAWAHIYTGIPLAGTQIRCDTAAQTTAVVTMSRDAAIDSIAIIGAGQSNNPQHDGIALPSGTGRTTIRSVTIAHCRTGISCSYTGVNLITSCQIHNNTTHGIKDPVDCLITNNYINANTQHALSLGSGANDNVISGNKLEWNDGNGVNANSTSHNVITDNNIDRNGKAGMRLLSNLRLVAKGNTMRRNGRLSSGVADEDCHFFTQSNTSTTFSANTTHHGLGDAGEGYDSPLVSIREQGGTDIVWTGNHLAGCTSTSPRNTVTAGTNVFYNGNSGLSVLQDVARHRVYADNISLGSIAAAGSATGTLNLNGALGTFTTGDTYRVVLTARRADNGARVAAELPLIVSRESGNALVTLGTLTNVIGTSFALTGGATMNVSVAVATDGSTLSITVANVSASAFVVGVTAIAR
jgi:hypothetical protein